MSRVKTSICAASLTFLTMFGSANAADFKVTGISLGAFTRAHFCKALGGQGKKPSITIKHSKVGGERIKVRMIDHFNNGGAHRHRSTTVKSDPSGSTKVDYAFLPPCNQNPAGNGGSNYWVYAIAGKSEVKKLWGKYP